MHNNALIADSSSPSHQSYISLQKRIGRWCLREHRAAAYALFKSNAIELCTTLLCNRHTRTNISVHPIFVKKSLIAHP